MRKRNAITLGVALSAAIMLSGCVVINRAPETNGTQPASTQAAVTPETEQTSSAGITAETEEATVAETEALQSSAETSGGLVSESTAKETAFTDAGVDPDGITTSVKLEKDDGLWQYDIDFRDGNQEFEYCIDAESGRILSKSVSYERAPSTAGAEQTRAILSEEQVKQIVIEKLPQASEDSILVHLDTDDGMKKYDGSLVCEDTVYDFEIDAETGDILEWDTEFRGN